MAFVYILQNVAGKFYIGSTVNIEKRLLQHRQGSTPTTKRLHADKLVFKQEYATLQEARQIELKIKRFKRRDFIKKIIKDGYVKVSPRLGSSVS